MMVINCIHYVHVHYHIQPSSVKNPKFHLEAALQKKKIQKKERKEMIKTESKKRRTRMIRTTNSLRKFVRVRTRSIPRRSGDDF